MFSSETNRDDADAAPTAPYPSVAPAPSDSDPATDAVFPPLTSLINRAIVAMGADSAAQVDEQQREMIGRIRPGWRVVGRIGEGGMGLVYKIESADGDERLAIKTIRPTSAPDEQMLSRRFTREGAALANLSHPNIIRHHSHGEIDGWWYLVMDYIEGQPLNHLIETLRSHAQEGKGDLLPTGIEHVRQCCDIGEALGDALDHAHQAGVLHRDIKPGNVLLDKSSRPVLLDFGLARHADDSTLTESQQVFGTLNYMSPEQLEDTRHVDARSDIYSLGVTLYELLSLEKPFEAESRASLVNKIIHEPVRPLSLANPSVPEKVERVIHKAIARDPQERYKNARAFVEDLHSAQDNRNTTAKRYIVKFDEHRYISSARPWSVWLVAGLIWSMGLGFTVNGLGASALAASSGGPGAWAAAVSLLALSAGAFWAGRRLLAAARWARWVVVAFAWMIGFLQACVLLAWFLDPSVVMGNGLAMGALIYFAILVATTVFVLQLQPAVRDWFRTSAAARRDFASRMSKRE